MKSIFLVLFLSFISFATIQAQFSESFNNGAIDASKWSGDIGNWTIVNSSTLAVGASNSNTLKLNVTSGSGGIKYLSHQIEGSWGEEQTWSFWMGREKVEASQNNRNIVWLWANNSDLSASSTEGYRIKVGDGTHDDIILEKVVGGETQSIITAKDAVLTGVTDYGIGVLVTKTIDNRWTLYTSQNITGDDLGINAESDISQSTYFNRNIKGIPIKDNTISILEGGYVGFVSVYSNVENNPHAGTAAEFDQFNFTPAIDHRNYLWKGTSSKNYSESSNWQPERTIKRNTDILELAIGDEILNVQNDVVQRISLHPNVKIVFNNSAPIDFTLIGNQPLEVPVGSKLEIKGNEPFVLNLAEGVKGEIEGELELISGSSAASDAHKIFVSDPGGLIVRGKIIQDCPGNLFGTSTTSSNNVIVERDGEFVSKSGANPFGNVNFPKIRFEEGSWYRHLHNGQFAYGGRTYANFELNNLNTSQNVTLPIGADSPCLVDNFILTRGNLNIQNKSSRVDFVVKETLFISDNASLVLNSSETGSSSIELTGAYGLISGSDRISFGVNSTLKVSENTLLNNDIRIDGTLFLNSGILNLNNHKITFKDNAIVKVLNGKLSAAPHPNSSLHYVYGDGSAHSVIKTGFELQNEATSITINNESGVVLNRPVTVAGELILSKGKLNCDDANFITLLSSASVSSSRQSFIDGPIAREIINDVESLFPCGYNNNYAPLSISPPPGNTASIIFKAAYYNEQPINNTIEPELKLISETQYWSLEQLQGEEMEVKVKLGWQNESQAFKDNLADLMIARLNGTTWENIQRTDINESDQIITASLNRFGLLAFAIQNVDPTPLRFISFTGYAEDNELVLKWTTAAEINNQGFVIEKSMDGISFTPIGFVKSSGDHKENKTYTFNDFEFTESSYYRLKQMDNNGTFEYSSVIRIEVNDGSPFLIVPNPVRESARFLGPAQTRINVEVKNLQGLTIKKLEGDLEEVNVQLNSMLKELAGGLYIVLISDEFRIQQLKFLKE